MLKNITCFSIFNLLLSIWVLTLLVFSFYTPNWLTIYNFAQFDKLKHTLGSFILAILFCKVYSIKSIKKSLFIWLLCSILVELSQQLITHGKRQFSVADIAANMLGFALGLITYIQATKLKTKYNKYKAIKLP